jgi:hypothetical protein
MAVHAHAPLIKNFRTVSRKRPGEIHVSHRLRYDARRVAGYIG